MVKILDYLIYRRMTSVFLTQDISRLLNDEHAVRNGATDFKHIGCLIIVIATYMDHFIQMLFIALKIADFFLLKQDKSSRAVYVPNMIIWVIGFVVYRILMNVDMPVGNTLPDMVITIILCLIAGKLIPEKNQKE